MMNFCETNRLIVSRNDCVRRDEDARIEEILRWARQRKNELVCMSVCVVSYL